MKPLLNMRTAIIAAAMCFAGTLAQAGQFAWSIPQPLGSSTAEQFLDNIPGTIAGAAVFNPVFTNQSDVLLNQTYTITSDGSVATVTGGGVDNNPAVYATIGSSGDAVVDAALSTFSWDGGPKTITMTNLTAGVLYTVQLFAMDSRNGDQTRQVAFQSVGDASNSDLSRAFSMGADDYIIGAFVATNTYQNLLMDCFVGGSGNLEMLVLRTNVNAGKYFIGTQPVPLKLYANSTANFSISEAGTSLTNQWQVGNAGTGSFTNLVNGGQISGATTTTLSVKNAAITNSADYRVIVSYAGGSVTSSPANLLVFTPSPSTYPSYLLSYNPIAYWRLNETGAADEYDVNNSGALMAMDYVGGHNGFYGSLVTTNNPGPQDANDGFHSFGNTNLSAGFVNNQVNIADPLAQVIQLPPLNQPANQIAYTIIMWVNPSSQPVGYGGLLLSRDNGADQGFTMDGSGFDLGYNWDNNSGSTWGSSSGLVMPLNEWSLAALVINSTGASFYSLSTNGFNISHNTTANIAQTFSGGAFWLGGDPNYNGARNFPGSIDEVAMFNYAMTDVQVEQIYLSAISTLVPPLISAQPQSSTHYASFGYDVTLSVNAIGTPNLGYQWYQSPVGLNTWTPVSAPNVTSTTNSTITFHAATTANQADYRVVITNGVGTATSHTATLTMLSSAPPMTWTVSSLNASAASILEVPGTSVAGAEVFGPEGEQVVQLNDQGIDFKADGSVATFTNVNTPPAPYGSGTGNGALSGKSLTGNSTFDTILDNFSWDGGPKQITLNNLTIGQTYMVELIGLDNRSGNNTRVVSWSNLNDANDFSPSYLMGDDKYVTATFTATATTQVIQENLPTSSSGNLMAVVILTNGVTSVPPTTIFSQPASSVSVVNEYYTGGPLHGPQKLSVGIAGSGETFQWQFSTDGVTWVNLNDGGIYSGTHTPTLSIANTTSSFNGYFQVVVNGSIISSLSSVSITPKPFPAESNVYAKAVLALNPVGYWRLNDAAGNATADEPWGGNVGTYDQGTSLSGVPGPKSTSGFFDFETTNTAAEFFNDNASYITINGLRVNTNKITIVAWINPNRPAPTYGGLVFNRFSPATGLGFAGQTSSANDATHGMPCLAYNWNNDGWQVSSGLFPPTNQWSMVATVIYGTNTLDPSVPNSSGALYLMNTSGIQKYVVTRRGNTSWNSGVWAGDPSYIGVDPNSLSGRGFPGYMDEVAVFQDALTTAQLTSLFNLAIAPSITLAPAPGGQITLTWPAGSLLEAPSISGPWTPNANSSPYTFTPSATQKFYRLLVN